jgi:3-hydroxyacyl-CoA dehydrogenase/enoyl-CoA hydratase/3-hydroxybutyryl-CoA epimerase
MAMSSPTSQVSWRRERDDRRVWTLWFDQPGRSYNVLDRPAIDELESHLADAEADPAIAGLILRGGKPSGLCAGVDLKSVLACRTTTEVEQLLRRGSTVLDRLSSIRVPTLAILHGVCLGAGLEMALACRRRVALASAEPLQVGLPEVHFGLVPAWGGISRLPRLIEPDDALDLLVSGRSIGYLRARSLGLVDRLAAAGDPVEPQDWPATAARPERTPSAEAWESALERARAQIVDQPGQHPEAQERILSLVELELARGREAARQATIAAFAELALSEHARESISSFLQRGRGPSGHDRSSAE